jgi:hypothetical protein
MKEREGKEEFWKEGSGIYGQLGSSGCFLLIRGIV